ncbi:protein transport protein Sec16A-like isoform X5 [Cydia pomonella]|uniref:protein transport protein Sec16A-like isoform X5 n=1 Tax=Cydia pomonella TaxID=82600 RepID=UPI002ADE14AB|nr:protein transport protein Sec16A-like isoform X5 [Cydia pomonella]
MEMYSKLQRQVTPPAQKFVCRGGAGGSLQLTVQPNHGQPLPLPPPEYLAVASKITAMQGYGPLGYDNRGAEGGSVHSGRSSANGLKGTDTYYGRYDASLRDAPSLRTDLSDRELNTDASLNLHLEDSTVRSERMTPFKFSTAHVKGNISSRHIVVVRPSYPVDGLPATVQIVSLSASLASDPSVRELVQYPGPLVKGVTHKKSVIEYCASRVRNAGGRDDVIGYVLLWQLLALLLKQNGVVVGIDIAELLMKNKRDYEFNSNPKTTQQADGRGSSVSEEDVTATPATEQTPAEEPSIARPSGIDEKAALDQLREYLTYGNRQEAIEWAMSHNLWGHAFQLCAHADRRSRAAVAARFVAGVPRNDPLHTLYHTLAGRQPPESEWGDWRAHAAIILSNTSAKPENETRTLTQLGDSLSSRGLLYSAQFCYISARVPFSRHPLAPFAPPPSVPTSPPRLALLLADSRADSLNQLATNEAIFATEIYEYALSLSQDYCIGELQAYKFLLACRLVDAGEYERALAYTEALARAVTRSPRDYPQQLVAQLYQLADRLKYHDPALHEDPSLVEEGEQSEPSPRHQQWLEDVAGVAQVLEAEAEVSKQATPVHQPPPVEMYAPTQYSWEQTQQAQPPEPYNTQPLQSAYPEPYQPEPYQPEEPYYPRQQSAEYADPEYWPQEQYQYEAPADASAAAGPGADEADEPRPQITMPGAVASRPALYADYEDDRPPSADTDRDTDTPMPTKKLTSDTKKQEPQKKSGWLGGIFTKLTLRPPNQMILPDDKNPSIVWDAVNKRWQNLDADGDESTSAPPPPPKTSDIPAMHTSTQLQAPPAAGLPPAAPVSNIFKMQKGRHIKKSYVDVFNPSGAPTRPLPPASEVLGPGPVLGAPPQYMLPQQETDNVNGY